MAAELKTDCRVLHVGCPPSATFAAVRRIGGQNGWYYANWLWRARCRLDGWLGGPGLRGRRDPDRLRTGDVIDCWRVESIEPGRRLRLVLELKQPGRGWLEFEVAPNGNGSTVRQTAMYDPQGTAGRLYWLVSKPFHRLIFPGMLRGIAAACRRTEEPNA